MGWRMSAVRRLRNVMCIMEWVPDIQNLQPLVVSGGGATSQEQRELLQMAFANIDSDNSGTITGAELNDFLKIIGMEGLCIDTTSEYTCSQIEQGILTQSFYKLQQGRYFVALGLEEAEHLRGAMHLLDNLGTGALCLRCLGNLESDLMESLVDELGPVISTQGAKYQRMMAEQVFRFVNCSSGFTQLQLDFMVRALQHVPLADRKQFWLQIRNCRRRPQAPWQSMPIARVFVTVNDYHDIAVKATIARVKFSLATCRLWPEDAFRKFDTKNRGLLGASELFEGLRWLRITNLTAEQLDDVFGKLDEDGDGKVDIDEFKKAFDLSDPDVGSTPQIQLSGGPERILSSTDELPVVVPAMKESGRFKVKVQPVSSFIKLWTTEGTLFDKPFSVWQPSVQETRGFFSSRVSKYIFVGFYVHVGFGKPEHVCSMLEVTDEYESNGGLFVRKSPEILHRFVEVVFPRPVSYRKLWEQRGAKSTLHVWEPVPPTDAHGALGVVATTSDEPPTFEQCLCRCVPREYTRISDKGYSVLMWTDGGVGSSKVALWTVPQFGIFHIVSQVSGTEPSAPVLNRNRFETDLPAELASQHSETH